MNVLRNVININRLVIVLAMVLVVGVPFGSATDITWTAKASGVVLVPNSATPFTGLLHGKSKQLGGNLTAAFSAETTGPTTGTCPIDGNPGQLVSTLVSGLNITRFNNNDFFVSRFDSGTFCFDPVTGTFKNTVDGTVTGGTGAFSDASGPYTATSSGQLLGLDSDGNVIYSITSSITGTITIP